MTKAELVNTISNKLGVEKNDTQKVIEAFMQEIKTSLYNNDNVYLRGFDLLLLKPVLQRLVETFLRIQLSKSQHTISLLSNLQKCLLRK